MGPRSANGTHIPVCSHTPRFSYSGPKTRVSGVAQGCGTGVRAVHGCGPGGYLGGVYRVGTREGYTGYYPARCSRREGPRQRSGPRKPQLGLEWVVWGLDGRTGDGGRGGSWVPTLRARSGMLPSLVPRTLRNAHLRPKERDSMTFLRNLVKRPSVAIIRRKGLS